MVASEIMNTAAIRQRIVFVNVSVSIWPNANYLGMRRRVA